MFFGYYDLAQISADGSRMLVHIAGKSASPVRDAAEIGYYSLPDGEYHSLASTRAWCRQQGARLRWHPLDERKVLYNDVGDDGSNYVTREIGIGGIAKSRFAGLGQSVSNVSFGDDGRRTRNDDMAGRTIAPALYDISSDFRYGVHINFARLQRLRPGYGYGNEQLGDRAPGDDGVFLVDLHTGEMKLVVSLKELALENDKQLKYDHYINHVSFCPDGSKFIFFHVAEKGMHDIWPKQLLRFVLRGAKSSGRIIRLFMYHIDTGRLEPVEDEWRTSHYCWKGNNELLTTSEKDGTLKYSLYNLCDGTKRTLEHAALHTDGHPTYFADGRRFVSDTPPDKNNMQKLFLYDTAREEVALLREFYHKPMRSREKRCDLHPRLWESGNASVITVDTTHSGGVRSVAMMELGGS